MIKRAWSFAWPPLVPLILLIAIFETAVRAHWIPAFLFPAPSQIAISAFDNRQELLSALFETASSAVSGLVLSFAVGVGIALLFSLSSFLRRAIYPYAIFFQTVPIIAIAPLLVIWFGFGKPTVIASAFIVSVFPIVASTLLGLQSTDPLLLDLFDLYGASRFAKLFALRLPFAMPQIFSGLRIASGLSVIGAIVGEFIAGGGLGSVVDAARTQQRVDEVFAVVLVAAALGLAMVGVVNTLSFFALRRWHASTLDRSV